MAADARPTMRSQFPDRFDLCAALAAIGIEPLDVSAERAIAVDGRSILDLVVIDGHLTDARTVEFAVLEHPSNASESPRPYLETVIDRLEHDHSSLDSAPADD